MLQDQHQSTPTWWAQMASYLTFYVREWQCAFPKLYHTVCACVSLFCYAQISFGNVHSTSIHCMVCTNQEHSRALLQNRCTKSATAYCRHKTCPGIYSARFLGISAQACANSIVVLRLGSIAREMKALKCPSGTYVQSHVAITLSRLVQGELMTDLTCVIYNWKIHLQIVWHSGPWHALCFDGTQKWLGHVHAFTHKVSIAIQQICRLMLLRVGHPGTQRLSTTPHSHE